MRVMLAVLMMLVSSGAAMAADCAPLKINNSVKMEPLVSQATVDELKLPELHSRFRLSNTHGDNSTFFVQVRDVQLGNAKTGGIQFQVMGNTDPNIPFGGILSTGFFAHDDFDLDFGAERLNFFSADHCAGKVVYWPHQALAMVPMVLEQSHINIPVTLDGHPLRAILDTGSPRTVLKLVRAREAFEFSPEGSSPPNGAKDNVAQQIYPRRFSTLSFDGVTVANPLIVIRPDEYGGPNDDLVLGSKAMHKDDQLNRMSPDLRIGMDVLRHLHIYVAMEEQKLYITEAGTGESPLFKPAAAAAN
jgi:hypothetical protein